MQPDSLYMIPLLEKFLKTAGASYKAAELAFALESHPFYPAISAVSQALTYIGVKNKVYHADYDGILKMASIALLHFNRKGDRFLLLLKATDREICCYEATGRHYIIFPKEDFLRQWSGAVLYITDNTLRTAYPVSYVKPLWKSSIPVWFLFFLVATAVWLCVGHEYYFSVLLLKIVGATVCLGIIGHESGHEPDWAGLVCHSSDSFDCNKVLGSSVARIFKIFSLAEVGMFYFFTGIIALIVGYIARYGQAVTLMLFYVSLCSLPFVIFSVFYQGSILKKWCPLCLAVAFILLMENFLFYIYPDKYISFTEVRPVTILLFAATMAALLVFFYRNLIRRTDQLNQERAAALKLKRHPAVVAALFRQQPFVHVGDKSMITIGCREADVSVVTVLHPFCLPCNQTARILCKLLKKFPDRLQWKICFDGIASDTLHPGNEAQLYLLELYESLNDSEEYLRIWENWLKHPSLKLFRSHYPLEGINFDTIRRFRFQTEENKKAGVDRLPYVVVNGRIMPENYTVSDIGYLMCDRETLRKATSAGSQEFYK